MSTAEASSWAPTPIAKSEAIASKAEAFSSYSLVKPQNVDWTVGKPLSKFSG